MKQREEVIFLIDSVLYDRNIFGITIEKLTKCRVFNFFSFEEALLYWNLNPTLIICDSPPANTSLLKKLESKVQILNISKHINTVPEKNNLKETQVAQKVAANVTQLLVQ